MTESEVSETQTVSIELTRDKALVLFDWLSRFNADETVKFNDQAEQRVLWDIEAILEGSLVEPFEDRYEKSVERARARVRDSEG